MYDNALTWDEYVEQRRNMARMLDKDYSQVSCVLQLVKSYIEVDYLRDGLGKILLAYQETERRRKIIAKQKTKKRGKRKNVRQRKR